MHEIGAAERHGSRTDVLVVGAGPTGLTAAAEARRHGLSVRVIDGNAGRTTYSKALVVHSRTLELFADMGIADRLVARGTEFRALNLYADADRFARIVFSELDWKRAPYPCWLSLPQSETEACLEEHLVALGGHVERERELVSFEEGEDGVHATLRRPNGELEACEAAWMIGCDGARSAVRQRLEIPFEGAVSGDVFILADVDLDWDIAEDEGNNFLSREGILLVVPMPEPKRWRIIAHLPGVSEDTRVRIDEAFLRDLVSRRTGRTASLSNVGWTSQFVVKHFLAARYRKGRVFLAGDAAHAHSPVGGQGLNTGVQDAYNLLFKLALHEKGFATARYLESYEAERHAVAASTVRGVERATKLMTVTNPVAVAVRRRVARVAMNADRVRNRLGRGVGMLDVGYRGSPVVGEPRGAAARIRRVLRTGPAPGDRAPLDAELLLRLVGGRHTLLLFEGLERRHDVAALRAIGERFGRRYGAPTRSLVVTTHIEDTGDDVLPDSTGDLHRRFGASDPALVLIRPDHHVAYRGDVDADALIGFVDALLVPRTEGPGGRR